MIATLSDCYLTGLLRGADGRLPARPEIGINAIKYVMNWSVCQGGHIFFTLFCHAAAATADDFAYFPLSLYFLPSF
jgi:hypothetical protein